MPLYKIRQFSLLELNKLVEIAFSKLTKNKKHALQLKFYSKYFYFYFKSFSLKNYLTKILLSYGLN